MASAMAAQAAMLAVVAAAPREARKTVAAVAALVAATVLAVGLTKVCEGGEKINTEFGNNTGVLINACV